MRSWTPLTDASWACSGVYSPFQSFVVASANTEDYTSRGRIISARGLFFNQETLREVAVESLSVIVRQG